MNGTHWNARIATAITMAAVMAAAAIVAVSDSLIIHAHFANDPPPRRRP